MMASSDDAIRSQLAAVTQERDKLRAELAELRAKDQEPAKRSAAVRAVAITPLRHGVRGKNGVTTVHYSKGDVIDEAHVQTMVQGKHYERRAVALAE